LATPSILFTWVAGSILLLLAVILARGYQRRLHLALQGP
jgi:hypothetical protein